jgi:hypothetical protein
MLEKVAVVAMLGAGNRMREEVLPAFKGRRVRIMMDADALKDPKDAKKKRSIPGLEAAGRWQEQLVGAGAAVEVYRLGPEHNPEDLRRWYAREIGAAEVRVLTPGLVTAAGEPVKDLNDLARCGREVLESADVREAFTCWDF